MRPDGKVWRKEGRHSARRREVQRPVRQMSNREIQAEAEALLIRSAYLQSMAANSLAFDLVMLGVPVQHIELDISD